MRTMWKRALLSLPMVLALVLLPGAAFAAEPEAWTGDPPEDTDGTAYYTYAPLSRAARPKGVRSGDLDRAPLTRGEIQALLRAAPLEGENKWDIPSGVFEEEPSLSAPYAPGRVRDSALQGALARLNAMRALAGLPAVELDGGMCGEAQYGAMAMAYLGTVTHYPAQGGTAGKFAELPEEVRTKAEAAVLSSNLSAGAGLTWAVDSLMDDSDPGNIGLLGHRRWQLNPAMGKAGFGYAAAPGTLYRQYVVEKVFDQSRRGQVDYDFVAWPASGNFPSNLEAFQRTSAWSVSLNPEKYQTPDIREVTVTLTGGGNAWTFRQGGSGGYFHVDTGYYGVPNCIIFRPDGDARFEGDYAVAIEGLRDRNGSAVSLRYTVSFFDAGAGPEKYRLSVTNGRADAAEYEEGDLAALTAEPPAPWAVFTGWTGDGTFADPNAAETVFTMPGHDAAVTANFAWPQEGLRFAARYGGENGPMTLGAFGEAESFAFPGMTLTPGDRIFTLDPATWRPLAKPLVFS